jgi:nicotinate-nucleotide--dimethylbenzimidazole phosphoribosyltransferase
LTEDAERVAALSASVSPVDLDAAASARTRHERLAKPPGSLGRLEALGATLASVARTSPPPIPAEPWLVICAADHGVVASGVSRWPQAVTAAMVATFLARRAASSAIAASVGVKVVVLDTGVLTPHPPHPMLVDARIRPGTADLSVGPAMGRDEALRAILAGARVADGLARQGADLVALGDMGIGNTTASACLIAALTGRSAAEATGRGAGADDDQLARKTDVVTQALSLHKLSIDDPLRALYRVGGLEHAAIVGLILATAAAGLPVVLDGVNTNAAALVAAALCPAVVGYLIAGHRSTEPGATHALAHLGLEPLLDLDMRLGEGSGALLAIPIVRAAARALAEMATIEEVA